MSKDKAGKEELSKSTPELLRLPEGPVDLKAIATDDHPGFAGKKADAKAGLADLQAELTDLQERLYAQGASDDQRRILLVLQGMDTSGKGGVVDHTVGLMGPGGVKISSFKAPTKEELKHDFLWRIKKALPGRGIVGVFDRSHYEDVLIARVRQLAGPEEIERRYGAINKFEQELVESGTTIIKCMLHISAETQKERLLARLDDPTKQWKFNPGDVDERAHWAQYRQAYEIALARTNTEHAPWYVIPSDKKWYRNYAIGQLLLTTLRGMDLTWPLPDYDVEEQRRRLLDEKPIS